jgi:hypothetical protein
MIATIIAHVVTGLLSAIGGWFLKVLHTWYLEEQAKKETAKAIDDAKKADNTSGIFS